MENLYGRKNTYKKIGCGCPKFIFLVGEQSIAAPNIETILYQWY